MTKNLRLLLIGMCGLAGIVLVTEFVVPMISTPSDILHGSRIGNQRAMEKRADAMVAQILNRPLFTQGRQPPQLKLAREEPPVLQSRLAGVMLQPDSREALFSRPNERPVTVREGDVIDGWTVEKIEEDRVVLTSAFGEQVVRPTNGGAGEVKGRARPAEKRPTPQDSQDASPVQSKRADTDSTPQKLALSEWTSQ